jgi:uncharacterized membrane protein YfcA
MDLFDAFIFLASGALAGMLGILLGLGGGFILVPVLSQYLDIPIHQAAAISIFAIIATSTAVSLGKLRRGMIDLKLATVLESSSVLGGIGGAFFALAIPGEYLSRGFSLMLLAVGGMMYFAPLEKVAPEEARERTPIDENPIQPAQKVKHIVPVGLGALFSGVASGMFGIGGSILTVPTLVMFGRIPMKLATACSGHIMGVTAAAGAIVYVMQGKVLAQETILVMTGVVLGVPVGIFLLDRVSVAILKRIFVVIVVFQSLRMW